MAVDLMHDVELGVGKAVVLHILRLLVVECVIEKFDERLVLGGVTNFQPS
jgi:hypothetical protein